MSKQKKASSLQAVAPRAGERASETSTNSSRKTHKRSGSLPIIGRRSATKKHESISSPFNLRGSAKAASVLKPVFDSVFSVAVNDLGDEMQIWIGMANEVLVFSKEGKLLHNLKTPRPGEVMCIQVMENRVWISVKEGLQAHLYSWTQNL